MNILFWLIVSVLVLIAYLFILPSFWRRQVIADADLDQENIIIAQYRLAELKQARQSGALTEADYTAQLADLELALSDDLDIKQHKKTVNNHGRWVIYVLLLVVPLLATGLYFLLGNYPAVSHTDEMSVDSDRLKLLEINKMVTRLAEKMQDSPEDGQGWLMLGRSYRALEQYPKAVEALANAYRLLGEKPEVMLLYADALANTNDKNLIGKPSELVAKVLTLEPDNMEALWLGGMSKAQSGEDQAAYDTWKRLLDLLPPDSQAQQQIQGLLDQLVAENPQVIVDQKSNKSATSNGIEVKVTVEITADLKSTTQSDDTVFIYAQAISGPKMPLAIARKKVSDLPISVTLNDAMAMMPNMKLSNFPIVKLLARVSSTGNAMPQQGDLIGTLDSVVLADKAPHKIVINGAVK